MDQCGRLLMEGLDGGGRQGGGGPLRAGEGDEPEASGPVQDQESFFGEQVAPGIGLNPENTSPVLGVGQVSGQQGTEVRTNSDMSSLQKLTAKNAKDAKAFISK